MQHAAAEEEATLNAEFEQRHLHNDREAVSSSIFLNCFLYYTS
jgi:hypothetical protein